MKSKHPPPPTATGDWKAWAARLIEWLREPDEIQDYVAPKPILLAHQFPDENYVVSVAGVVMYDASDKHIVYSADNEWKTLVDAGALTTSLSDYYPKTGGILNGDIDFTDTNHSVNFKAGSTARAEIRAFGVGDLILSTYDPDDASTTLVRARLSDTDFTLFGNSLTGTPTNSSIMTKQRCDSVYVTQTDAAADYMTYTYAANNYLLATDAASTYLTQSSASSTYLTQSSAASTYLPLDPADKDVTGTLNLQRGSVSDLSINFAGSATTLKDGMYSITGVGVWCVENSVARTLIPFGTNIGSRERAEVLIRKDYADGRYQLASSDQRLKAVSGAYLPDAESIHSFKPVRYSWLETDNRKVGLIAQDVEAVLPEAVGLDTSGYKTLDALALVAHLIGVIQDLERRLHNVEQELDK